VAAAALWLLEAGPRLFGTNRLMIGGESAGAHLALVTLLRLRAEGALAGVAGAVLNYGCFDLRLSPSMARWGSEGLVLSTPVVEWFVDNLTGGDRALRADPALSPLLADLSGLPPVLVQVGTFDPLIDDSLGLAAGLVRAGVPVDLRLYPGGVHGFDRFHTALAAEANAAAAAFVRACL
jgi:acetyl esterase/lipase